VTRRRSVIAASLVVVALVLAGCGGDDGSGSDGDTQDPAALEGESWILTQMLTAGGQTEIVDVGVNASFDGTTISGVSGCNRYNASY
jgi:heat shock protein HslJ